MTDLTLTEREKALIALAATSAAKVATEELAVNNEQLAIALERAEEAEAEAEAVRATATEAMSTLGDLACAWALECGQTLGVSCVYCGAEWGQHEYATLDRAHAFDCPKHPMREVERERDGAMERLRCESEAHAGTLAELTAAEERAGRAERDRDEWARRAERDNDWAKRERAESQAATERAEKAERAWRMHREAWIRELGGVLIPKAGGEIDSLVATTQRLRERAEKAESALQASNELPSWLRGHVDRWLEVNKKRPEDVRHGRFPLGMVTRWIDRANNAESSLQAATEREGRMREALASLLDAARIARSVLDSLLGDTDPSDPEEPRLVACRELSEGITEARAALAPEKAEQRLAQPRCSRCGCDELNGITSLADGVCAHCRLIERLRADLQAATEREGRMRAAWGAYRAKLIELHGRVDHPHAEAYGWVRLDVDAALAPEPAPRTGECVHGVGLCTAACRRALAPEPAKVEPCGCGANDCAGPTDAERHSCGGPGEACMVSGCPECSSRSMTPDENRAYGRVLKSLFKPANLAPLDPDDAPGTTAHPLVGTSHGGTTVTSHHVHLPHCATQHGHEHCDCLVGREGA